MRPNRTWQTPARLWNAGRRNSWRRGGKALERNGLGAFLLAEYPYRLDYGGAKPQCCMTVSDAGHSRSDKPAAYVDSDGDTLCQSCPRLKMLGSETAQQ